MSKLYSGAEIVFKCLEDQGVKFIFGYPGGAVLPIYDELKNFNSVKHILVRHEQGAGHAAEGYARSSGKPGVLLVTSGPGATNAVTALTDAYMDSVPLVCISGQVPTHLIGTDAFQEADTTGISRPATKHNYLVKNSKDLCKVVHEAFEIASNGRPGPVLIDLPKDVQFDQVFYEKKTNFKKSIINNNFFNQEAIEKTAELLVKAKKPIIYGGGGIINSGPEASLILKNIVKELNAPVTLTLMGLGAIPHNNPNFLGMLGMHGTYEANLAMHHCDVMLNVGARFDDRVTGRLDAFSPNSKKIHIDIDESNINKTINVDVPIIGDVKQVVEKMISVWKDKKYKIDTDSLKLWWDKINKWKEVDCLNYNNEGKQIKPQYAVQRLYELTKNTKTFITTEVGQHQMWAAQFYKFEEPNRWLTSGGLGTMGYGFPAAIGVQIAHPKSLVICVAGEASFLMNLQELSTVKQYRLPVKIFILNNKYLGMVRQWQEFFHGGRYSESYTDSLPDFVKLAESYGIKGVRATQPEDLEKVIGDMIDYDGPVIADICVDEKENVFPMIPSGAAHNEMKLKDSDNIATSTKEGKMLV